MCILRLPCYDHSVLAWLHWTYYFTNVWLPMHAIWLHFTHSLGCLLTTRDLHVQIPERGTKWTLQWRIRLSLWSKWSDGGSLLSQPPFVLFTRITFLQLQSIFQSFSHFVILLLYLFMMQYSYNIKSHFVKQCTHTFIVRMYVTTYFRILTIVMYWCLTYIHMGILVHVAVASPCPPGAGHY